ncbi:hypothetical protein SCP_1602050 [Sparassis crispa]|uniref:BTB domain-containing protein n=1 Tax=Sparassis crispa TaxID=139825 RepID=A0A401H571_9APHY|nr:hypothetical protein SCP_1602050 [Sparassis crispa]GBE89543.1 hypothetical protein SCP_1602050 [Sparassis crispa]
MESSRPASPVTLTPQWAQRPFDNPAANIILRSSDNIDFCVHSVILSEASPFFKDMFSLQQPLVDHNKPEGLDDYRDGRPVIVVGEGSRTLDSLLRLCYPIAGPKIQALTEGPAVLEAALKYQMEEATGIMSRALMMFAADQPLRIWAIACRLRLEGEARYAARFTLTRSIFDDFPKEMQEVTAGPYFRLLKYHRLQGNVGVHFTFLSPNSPKHVSQSSQVTDSSSLDFVGYPFADLICRSSDGVEFLTHKVILSIASPILHTLITSLPANQVDTDQTLSPNNLPILSLEENGRTLTALLKLCYPVEESSTKIDDFSIVQSVLEAAKKYDMARVAPVVRKHWASLADAEPLRAYFTAVQHNFDECARQSAKNVLEGPIENAYVSEMEDAPAQAYYRLLRYYHACQDILTTAFTQYGDKIKKKNELTKEEIFDHSCSCNAPATEVRINLPDSLKEYATGQSYSVGSKYVKMRFGCTCKWKGWFNQHFASSAQLWHDSPAKARSCDSYVTNLLKTSVDNSSWCSSCRPLAERFADFARDIGSSVNGRMAQVQLEL